MRLEDLPDFIRCDTLADEHGNLVPIVPNNILDALNIIGRSRTELLEEIAASVYAAFSLLQFDDPSAPNFSLGSVGHDLGSYNEYLRYASSEAKEILYASRLDALMMRYADRCKARWTQELEPNSIADDEIRKAMEGYREALIELGALNTEECLKTQSVIRGARAIGEDVSPSITSSKNANEKRTRGLQSGRITWLRTVEITGSRDFSARGDRTD
jgi:hypothetical protein